MFFVLLALSVLGALAVAFHLFSRQAQATAFRFEQKAITRQIAEAASEEAFMRFYQATSDTGTSEGKWMTGTRSGKLAIQVPTTTQFSPSLVRLDCVPEIEAWARFVDFRDVDSRGTRYPPNEGVGTIELGVTARLRSLSGGGKKPPVAVCTILRHHDFKILTIVSQRDNRLPRTSYAQNYVLDYALFVRSGLLEFRRGKGTSINPGDIRISISQDELFRTPEKLGKVFFGGTSDPNGQSTAGADETPKGNLVFLNIAEANKALVPTFDKEGFFRVGLDDCLLLFPKFGKFRDYLKGMEGVFSARNVPLVRDEQWYKSSPAAQLELSAKNGVLAASKGAEENLLPGLNLISKDPAVAAIPANAENVFEGAVRQRFLSFVHFYLDVSKVDDSESDQVKECRETKVPCIPLSDPPPRDKDVKAFCEGLKSLEKKVPPGTPPLVSRFNADFLLKGGQQGPTAAVGETFKNPPPAFFSYKGQSVDITAGGLDSIPFRHVNLRARDLVSQEQFERLGFYDPREGTLNLRGIIRVNAFLVLGDPAIPRLKVRGRGVIMAKGFRLLSGIEKDRSNGADPICVLYARDEPIFVETGEPIQASLIAMGGGSNYLGLRPSKPLKLFGSLAVDFLETGQWSTAGENTLEYDPVLKAPSENLFQINISRWVTFHRVEESDPEGKPEP